MKVNGDKIIIESRKEIELLQKALQIAKEQSDGEIKQITNQIYELLDSMWYSW